MKHSLQKGWAAVSMLLALVLVACGGSTGSTTAGSTQDANTPVVAQAATNAPTETTQAASTPVVAEAVTSAPPAVEATTPPVSTPAPAETAAVPTTPAATTAATSVASAPAKLNLNTVTGDQLLSTIPNFGNRMVREFEEYRPYISITQFRKEIGKYVDAAQIAQYEQYVYVPVAVDESDAATLQQLSGVDATEADQLIAARPYGSNAAFLTKLAAYVSVDELTTAEAFLAE